jgi:hypothetical protein
MFVLRIREVFPDVPVTECHPKALLNAIARDSWDVFARDFAITATPSNEHIRDAIVAAVAARESFSGTWTHDLSDMRLPGEQDPRTYWLAPVHYYWPEV